MSESMIGKRSLLFSLTLDEVYTHLRMNLRPQTTFKVLRACLRSAVIKHMKALPHVEPIAKKEAPMKARHHAHKLFSQCFTFEHAEGSVVMRIVDAWMRGLCKNMRRQTPSPRWTPFTGMLCLIGERTITHQIVNSILHPDLRTYMGDATALPYNAARMTYQEGMRIAQTPIIHIDQGMDQFLRGFADRIHAHMHKNTYDCYIPCLETTISLFRRWTLIYTTTKEQAPLYKNNNAYLVPIKAFSLARMRTINMNDLYAHYMYPVKTQVKDDANYLLSIMRNTSKHLKENIESKSSRAIRYLIMPIRNQHTCVDAKRSMISKFGCNIDHYNEAMLRDSHGAYYADSADSITDRRSRWLTQRKHTHIPGIGNWLRCDPACYYMAIVQPDMLKDMLGYKTSFAMLKHIRNEERYETGRFIYECRLQVKRMGEKDKIRRALYIVQLTIFGMYRLHDLLRIENRYRVDPPRRPNKRDQIFKAYLVPESVRPEGEPEPD